jgi:hypothetical protein
LLLGRLHLLPRLRPDCQNGFRADRAEHQLCDGGFWSADRHRHDGQKENKGLKYGVLLLYKTADGGLRRKAFDPKYRDRTEKGQILTLIGPNGSGKSTI